MKFSGQREWGLLEAQGFALYIELSFREPTDHLEAGGKLCHTKSKLKLMYYVRKLTWFLRCTPYICDLIVHGTGFASPQLRLDPEKIRRFVLIKIRLGPDKPRNLVTKEHPIYNEDFLRVCLQS